MSTLQSNNWRSWLVLFARWLLGGLTGIAISAWIYFGLKNSSLGMPLILRVPFEGHIHIYFPDANTFAHVTDFLITFPVLFWRLICALLASGRKEQIKAGTILLVLWVIIGWISFFWVILRYIPT